MKILLYLIFALCIIVVLFSCKKTTQTYKFNLTNNPNFPSYLFVPVTINNNPYSFLFDTGTELTLIDSFASKTGLNTDKKTFITLQTANSTKISDSVGCAKLNYSIDNFHSKGIFYVLGREQAKIINKVGAEAILGMDKIKQFNWLFNFADSMITFSKDKIELPALPDDKILTLDFYTKPGGGTNMNITLDGQCFQDILFDTGFETFFSFFGKEQSIDIIFNEPDFTAYRIKQGAVIGMDTDTGLVSLIDSIQINDFKMHSIVATKNPKVVTNTIITANFVRRFRMMYFDSKNRKIQLYVSPSDSARYERKDIQEFIKTYLPRIQENNGDTVEIKTSEVEKLIHR